MTEARLVIANISYDVLSGRFRAQYGIHITTDSCDQVLGSGETANLSEDLSKRMQDLVRDIESEFNVEIGLADSTASLFGPERDTDSVEV